MFPLKDDIPSNRLPVVNTGLIVLNAVIFIYEYLLGPQSEGLIMEYGFVPARFISQLFEDGPGLQGFGTIFSSMFLHGSILHLVSNMWMLWIFGDNVEDSMGHGRYLLFFLLCGAAAVFVQAAAGPGSRLPLIGASGAISGVLGAYFLTYPRARVLTLIPIFIFFYLFEMPAYFFIGFWFVMQFLSGTAHLAAAGQDLGGVAWWAHIGGFIMGVGLIRFFRRQGWQRQAVRRAVGRKRIGIPR